MSSTVDREEQNPPPLQPPDGAGKKETFLGRHGQKLLALSFWVVVIGGLLLYTRLNGLTITDGLAALVSLLRQPVVGPLIYIAIYTIRPLFFFAATVLTVLGGSIYGPLWGVVWVIIGSNLSTVVAYYVGRFFGAGLLDENNSENLVGRYAQRLRQNSFETTMLLRLMFAPYDLVSYLAGLLRIHLGQFILATALSAVPGTISFVLLGASVSVDDILAGQLPQLQPWALVASVVLFVVGITISASCAGVKQARDRIFLVPLQTGRCLAKVQRPWPAMPQRRARQAQSRRCPMPTIDQHGHAPEQGHQPAGEEDEQGVENDRDRAADHAAGHGNGRLLVAGDRALGTLFQNRRQVYPRRGIDIKRG